MRAWYYPEERQSRKLGGTGQPCRFGLKNAPGQAERSLKDNYFPRALKLKTLLSLMLISLLLTAKANQRAGR
jgi:hypothetical protein